MQAVSDSLHIGPLALAVDWQAAAGKAGTILVVLLLTWIGWRVVLAYTRRIEEQAVQEQEETGLLSPERQRARTVAQLGRNVGMVERLTLWIVVLRDVQGVVHIIPNGEIKQVSNLTKEWSRAFLEMGVAYGEDVDRVMEVLREIGTRMWEDPEWNRLLMEEPEVPGVERFDDSAVVVRMMAKTKPLKQWE